MPFINADRIKETTITTGTGPLTLAGAVVGFRSFLLAPMATNDTCSYAIVSATGLESEAGIGTFTSPNILTRTTVQSSSNGNAAVNFSAGVKDVFIGPIAGTQVPYDPVTGTLGLGVNALNDVAITSPTVNQVLKYSGTEWTNQADAVNVGTVTIVSVVAANGFVGTVADPNTAPAITLTTSITGLLKGNASALLAAVAGTDYVTPTGSAAGLTSFPTLNQNTTGNAATVTTNANLTGHITSVGNAAVLGSFTSAQLATALTDETGTGAAVFAISPTLVTPLSNTLSAIPVTVNGPGNSVTIAAGSGVAGATSNPGGSLILQAGKQGDSGGDGAVIVKQLTGQVGSLFFVNSSFNDNLIAVANNGDVTLKPKAAASSSTVPVLSGIRNNGQAGWNLDGSGFKFSNPGNADHFVTLGSGAATLSDGLRFNFDNACTFAIGSNRDYGATLWTSNQGAGKPLLGRRFSFTSSTVAAQSGPTSSLPVVGELFSFGVNGINYWPNIISLASNVNDLVHTGEAELRINCTVASDITGIKYGFGKHMDGRIVELRNVGTANITIKNKNTGSYQNNRFVTLSGFDYFLAPGNVSSLVYDLTVDNGSAGISITNVSRTSNIATFTTSTEAFVRAGYTVVVSGMSDASFNGTYIANSGNDGFSNGQLTFTLPNTGSNLSTTSMAGLAIVRGGWRANAFSSISNSTSALTVATLPAAATAGAGARAFVSDATLTTFATFPIGGGANGVPVYSDGTNWYIG